MNGIRKKADTARGSTLSLLIGLLVLVLIVVHATSWAFPLRGEKGPRLSVADVLIWVSAAMLVVYLLKERRLRDLLAVPLPAVLFVLLAAGSVVFAERKLPAVADVVQCVEYFVLLHLLFVNVITTRERLRLVVTLWMTVASIVAIWALVQYLQTDRAPVDVAATFLNRNLLSGYLAIAVPMAWGLMLGSPRIGQGVQSLALAAVGLVVMLAGGPWIAAAVAVAVISVVRSPRLFGVLALMLLVVGLFVVPILPRNNVKVLTESLAVFNEDEDLDTGVTVGQLGVVERDRLSPRYIEWQAAMKQLTPGAHKALGLSPKQHLRQLLLGVGIGNYQSNISRLHTFIDFYQPPNRNLTEPDTQNFYLVTAVQTGLPAVLVFLWLVVGFLYRAGASYGATGDPLLSGVALGCVGSLVSLLIVNVFTPTLVHGLGPAMILVFALVATVGNLIERTQRASSS